MAAPENLVESGRRRWLVAGAWVLLIAALVVGFEHNFWEMWQRWFPAWRHADYSLYDRFVEGESYYTHGPLVPLVFLVIVLLLIRHTSIPVRPRPVAGGVLLALSLLLHLTACLARVNFASGFAFVGVLAGLVLMLWGRRALRRLWFPIALLLFMVPLPEVTIYNWNFHLKIFAAKIGVEAVSVLGIPAVRSDNIVYLPDDKVLVIANICNGLRTIISLLAFGALYAYVCKVRGFWRLLLFGMSLPVAVVSNSIRIVSLILVAHWWDVETATGWYHDWSGILIFAVAFGMMFGLERLILWAHKGVGRPVEIKPLFHNVRRTEADETQWSQMLGAAASGIGRLALVLLVPATALACWLNMTATGSHTSEDLVWTLPRTLDIQSEVWRSEDLYLASRRPPLPQPPKVGEEHLTLTPKVITILENPSYHYRRYESGSAPPMEFLLLVSKNNRKAVHPPDRCFGESVTAKDDRVLSGVTGYGDVPCRELISRQNSGEMLTLYTYKCGDTYTRSFWWQQFTVFVNGLLGRNAIGAQVRVDTPVTATDTRTKAKARARAKQLLRAAIPYVDRRLAMLRAGWQLPKQLEIDGRTWRDKGGKRSAGAGGQNVKKVELQDCEAGQLKVRNYLLRKYTAEGARPIEFSVVLCGDYRDGVDPTAGPNVVKDSDVVVKDAEGRFALACRGLIVKSGGQRRYVLYTRKTASGYKPSYGRTGALIRVSTVVDSSVADARNRCAALLRTAFSYLNEALPSDLRPSASEGRAKAATTTSSR